MIRISRLQPLLVLGIGVLSLFGCDNTYPGNESTAQSSSVISSSFSESSSSESSSSASSSSESESSSESIPIESSASSSEESSEGESVPVVTPEEKILQTMSLEEKVGQLFLARLPDENAVQDALGNHLGGFIWFGKDFVDRTPKTVRNEIRAIQDAVSIPLFMAVDEEGGDVTRISSYPQFRSYPFLSAYDVYVEDGWEGVTAFAAEQATLLSDLDFNLNLAPVVDVPYSADNFIYSRAFSTHVERVKEFAMRYVSVYQDYNVGTVLKHFPGYGGNTDTHTGVAYDERPLATLWERDLQPFVSGVEAGTEGVLVAHNVITAVDPNWPATLSPKVIKLLRDEIGFEGIIITDDLVMEGLKAFAPPEDAAVLAVLAGNDMLISSELDIQLPTVMAAVNDGRISVDRIDESVLRILRIKLKLGLFQ